MRTKRKKKSLNLDGGECARDTYNTKLCRNSSSQEAPTNIADLFRNVCSHIRDVPHGHERVKARALLSLLDVRLVGEAEVMSNGCQKHLHTDDKILRETGQFSVVGRLCFTPVKSHVVSDTCYKNQTIRRLYSY